MLNLALVIIELWLVNYTHKTKHCLSYSLSPLCWNKYYTGYDYEKKIRNQHYQVIMQIQTNTLVSLIIHTYALNNT